MPDIIGVLNEQDDYTRKRNYWKYLKAKLKKKESNEVVSATNQLKLHAPDGKMRLTDVLDALPVRWILSAQKRVKLRMYRLHI